MPYFIGPANVHGGKPQTRELGVAASQTFKVGAILVYSSGLVAEGGANPTAIVGVAAAPANSALGYELSDATVTTPVTWAENLIPVHLADTESVYVSKITNNSAVYIAPVAANVGVQYGLTEQSTGEWTLDISKTGANARAMVVDIDTDQNLAFWKFEPLHIANV